MPNPRPTATDRQPDAPRQTLRRTDTYRVTDSIPIPRGHGTPFPPRPPYRRRPPFTCHSGASGRREAGAGGGRSRPWGRRRPLGATVTEIDAMPQTTNITEEHHRAFEALTSGKFDNFCLFSCTANDHPAAAIAAVTVQPSSDGSYRHRPGRGHAEQEYQFGIALRLRRNETEVLRPRATAQAGPTGRARERSSTTARKHERDSCAQFIAALNCAHGEA